MAVWRRVTVAAYIFWRGFALDVAPVAGSCLVCVVKRDGMHLWGQGGVCKAGRTMALLARIPKVRIARRLVAVGAYKLWRGLTLNVAAVTRGRPMDAFQGDRMHLWWHGGIHEGRGRMASLAIVAKMCVAGRLVALRALKGQTSVSRMAV